MNSVWALYMELPSDDVVVNALISMVQFRYKSECVPVNYEIPVDLYIGLHNQFFFDHLMSCTHMETIEAR